MIELLLPFFTHTVTVPALRYRIEDIEVLVPFLLRELTSGADVRLAADAMRQLSNCPGRATWHSCGELLRKPLRDNVQALSVPTSCRPSAVASKRRKLTQMEALERDAIVRSLEDNGNNKLQAAISLGDVAGDATIARHQGITASPDAVTGQC